MIKRASIRPELFPLLHRKPCNRPNQANMSVPNRVIVDVDGAGSRRNDTTVSSAFRLPDGRLMDSKNTLQSFDDMVAIRSSQHVQISSLHGFPPPILRNGHYPIPKDNDDPMIVRAQAVPVQS